MSRFARFMRHVEKRDNGCWIWTAAVNSSGYGMFSLGARGQGNQVAHRFSFELHHRPLEDGESVLHSCHQRRCVNPQHLRAGTHLENMRDMVVAGRSLRGVDNPMRRAEVDERFKRTAPRGSQHHAAVLNEELVALIRSLSKGGMSGRAIARAHGLRQRTVARVIRGEAWTHV